MIEIRNVSKTYPTGTKANDDICFNVDDGHVVALVGPNGSGKTTLIQQILGVIKIGEGSIWIDGISGNVKSVAYVPQFPAIYPALTVRETLLATAKYLGMRKRQAVDKVNKVIECIELSDIINQPSYTLSGGQKKLLAFGCALVQDAQNLVLDEVTSMVDVVTKELIWKLIREEQKKGKAILLSSHDLSEVRKLSTQIVVLQEGRVILRDSPQKIGSGYCHCYISVESIAQAEQILLDMGSNYEIKDARIGITTCDISQMVAMLTCIARTTEIQSLACEYPEFYEGLLAILKKSEVC